MTPILSLVPVILFWYVLIFTATLTIIPIALLESKPKIHRTEPGDAGGSPGKSSLFFLTGFHPEIRLSGDRV